MLRIKLSKLDEWNARRKSHAAFYLNALDGIGLGLPEVASGAEPVWHLFVVQCKQRDALQAFLREQGIETLIHYPTPPWQQGAYANSAFNGDSYPISQRLHTQVLSLPMGPHLSTVQAERVVAACHKASAAGLMN